MSRSPSVTNRHFLELSPLSPWDRSNSDTSLATSPKPSRRQFSTGNQFRGQLEPDGDLEFRPEYRESYLVHPVQDACACRRFARVSLPRRLQNQTAASHTPASLRKLSSSKEDFHACEHHESNTESQASYQPFDLHDNRPPLLRRHSTTLNLYGDRIFDSEYVSSFAEPQRFDSTPRLPFEGQFRSDIKFQNTELMDSTPEYRSAFIDFPRQRPVVRRPKESLFMTSDQRDSPRRPTTLELESLERPASVHANFSTPSFDPDIRPEYQDSFKDFPRRRPDVPRPPASLTPDGPWFGQSAEYKASFVEFPRHRPEMRRHINSLRGGGLVDSNVSTKFMSSKKLSPSKPLAGLELDKSPMDGSPEYREVFKNFPRRRPEVKKPPNGLKPEGDFYDQNEYKENYKDSPRMRPKVIKPSANLKPEGEICNGSPEYKENYKNFPRKRPEVKKPPAGLKPEGDMMEKSPEYKEAFKDFPRQRPKTPRPSDSLKTEGNMEEKPEYRTEFVDHPRHRPEVPRPETTLRPRGPWLGRFPEYRAAFIDLPRQRPVTPRPLSNLNSDTLGGGYVPQFNEKQARASSAGPMGHAHQRSPSPQNRGRSKKKKKSASSAKLSASEPAPKTEKAEQVEKPATSPTRVQNKDLPSELPQHIKSGEPEKLDLTLPHAYKTRRSPIRIAPSAVSAYRVLEVCGVDPPEGDDADKGREPGDGKWGSGWLARHHSRA